MDDRLGPVQVTVTVDDEQVANRLARTIVEARLAACAQVSGPINSTFRWQGVVTQKIEWHCFLKTTADCVEALEAHIARRYPADTPEIIAVPIVGGSVAYLEWIQNESRGDSRQ